MHLLICFCLTVANGKCKYLFFERKLEAYCIFVCFSSISEGWRRCQQCWKVRVYFILFFMYYFIFSYLACFKTLNYWIYFKATMIVSIVNR